MNIARPNEPQVQSPVSARLSEELRAIIARRRLTPARVADTAGIHRSTFSRKINGLSAWHVDDLPAVCRALELDPSDTAELLEWVVGAWSPPVLDGAAS